MKILSEEFFHLVIGNHASTTFVSTVAEVLCALLGNGQTLLVSELLRVLGIQNDRCGFPLLGDVKPLCLSCCDCPGADAQQKKPNLLFIVVYNPLSLFVF